MKTSKCFETYFHPTENRVHHSFSNGIILSAIWGTGSYTKYRDERFERIIADPEEFEIALLDLVNGKFIGQTLMPELFSGDDVRGWVSQDELFDIIERIKQIKYRDPYETDMIVFFVRRFFRKLKDRIKKEIYYDNSHHKSLRNSGAGD